MEPRGQRLAASLRTMDGAIGAFSAYPGTTPKSIAKVDPVEWNKPPEKPVHECHFSTIGDLGMTGRVIMLNQYQWRALTDTKLEEAFYASILWGGNPMKVVENATMLAKRFQK